MAADGRVEISQASVEAAGGYPFSINQPGSYVLTSNLVVPADTDALVLEASQVVIDLNGFSIRGPFTCGPSACPSGTGSAVRPGPSVAFGHDSTVRNGSASGFAGSCVQLGSLGLVTELIVSDCGEDGIAVGEGSIVSSNRVTLTGEHGIRMAGTAHPPAFEHNTVSLAGLGGSEFASVSGGKASGGNSCDDGACAPNGQRRFYQSAEFYPGQSAATGCSAGFHVAQFSEIMNPSGLFYDEVLGSPISSTSASFAWVSTVAGTSCSGYTSSGGDGTAARISNPASGEPQWSFIRVSCGGGALNERPVWCVEN
jgi:hypothetical protein